MVKLGQTAVSIKISATTTAVCNKIKEVAIRRYTQNPPYWFYSCVSTDTKLSVDTPFTDT